MQSSRKKKKTSQTYHYVPVAFCDQIIDSKDEPEKNFIRSWW